jgi:hypothetical protein
MEEKGLIDMDGSAGPKGRRLSIWYLFPMIMIFIALLPPVLSSPPFVPFQGFEASGIYWSLIASYYVGLACMPGYIEAWNGHHSGKTVTGVKRTWIKWSLIIGFISLLYGGAFAIWAVVPTPFVIWALVMVVMLMWRFHTT